MLTNNVFASGAVVLLHHHDGGTSSGDATPFIYITMGLIIVLVVGTGVCALGMMLLKKLGWYHG